MTSIKDLKLKSERRRRRKLHIRRRVFGTVEKPRLTVFRSHKHIYCQLIDDQHGVTLASASTRDKEVRAEIQGFTGNAQAAEVVGRFVAKRALEKGITKAAFDRNGYKFHGRVKALAEAARKAGLQF